VSSKLIAKAQRLLAQERQVFPSGSRRASADRSEELSIALAFPNRYYTGMSNLGFQTVYHLLNEQPGTRCERVFWPDPEEGEEYRRSGMPLFSLERQRPIRSFDILAFSLSFENDYPHLLQMLELAKIPLRKEERTETDPLVIAGGATVSMNPEPLADFIDLFLIGEAEALLTSFLQAYREGRRKSLPKEALLAELAALEGIYVPQFYTVKYGPEGTLASFIPEGPFPARIQRVWMRDLNEKVTMSSWVTPHTELASMFLVELSRGCPRGCRFCASCYTYAPYRVRDPESLKRAVVQRALGEETVGLVGSAISDYPQLVTLGRGILEAQKALSFSSLRVDSFSPELANLLLQSGQKTVTLAPEAGSERMRRVVRKGFTEEEILLAAETLAERGIRSFRLYFMVGLPGETAEDAQAIVGLTKRIRHHLLKRSRGEKKGERIILSLNSFVPKPATPFQWHPFEEVRSLHEKIREVKKGLRQESGVTVAADVPKWAYLQSLLSRGDRRVGKILLRAHELGENWPQVYRSVEVNPDFFVYRRRSREELLPWDFIDHGVSKEFLWGEYQEALKEGAQENSKGSDGPRVQGFKGENKK
jgi:radical SAM family uncharacterized protein